MTPERWQRIDEIFQAAIELTAEERPAFVEIACSGDNELRREVESLITADDQGLSFIDEPAVQVAASLLATGEPELVEGQSIGHYEIVGLIGRGGMGEVYLAKDNRLNRQIALKFLPADYTKHKDRLRRFQREAQAVSALNHPNILTIHELGEVNGQQFIATEFVDGETLRQRLKRGPLALSETLEIAVQAASALAAAHQAGIVHRDIKPENIMLRPDGYVKVLDFGLAKLTQQEERPRKLIKTEKTEMSSGLVMGTFKYMSPEQARGQSVDPRSDIFSFGVVLYELLAGRAPFEGETTSELIAAILKKDPLLLADAPAELQQLINKALRKKKEDRYRNIQELLIDLRSLQQDEAASGGGVRMASATTPWAGLSTSETAAVSTQSTLESIVSGIKRHKTGTVLLLASLAVVVTGLTVGLKRLGGTLRTPSMEVKIKRVPDLDKAAGLAISPNGEQIVYAERAGTGKPNAGQSLWALNVSTNQREQIVPPADIFYGGLTYSPDAKEIFYNNKEVIYKVNPRGGEASMVLADVSGAISFAPDGAQFAFVRGLNDEENALMVANADGSGERILARRKKPQFFSPDGPAWSPDGSLIACAAGELAKNDRGHLIGFDPRTGDESKITEQRWDEIRGRILWLPYGTGLIAAVTQGSDEQIWEIPYPVGVAHRITSDPNHNYWDLSLTADGKSLITLEGATRSGIWLATDGDPGAAKPITSGENHLYRNVAWTPDGRVLYTSNIGNSRDIWIMNADGTAPKQLTDVGISMQPAASADGRYVVFSANRAQDGAYNLWRINMDGSDPVQLTYGGGEGQPNCSPDGRWVVYSHGGPNTTPWEKTLWRVSINGGETVQLTDKPSAGPSISPDGTLIACWYAPDAGTEDSRPPMKMALIPFAGGAPVNVFDATWIPPPNGVRWTADGQAISYQIVRAGVANIWNQPVGGGPPKQITQFTSEQIAGFDWSRNGQLACARAHGVQEVVKITDFR